MCAPPYDHRHMHRGEWKEKSKAITMMICKEENMSGNIHSRETHTQREREREREPRARDHDRLESGQGKVKRG
jgi:hypothetical protein